ncbi:hypothetical protein FGIG_00677 [Fasciola gigantica]|uniref:BAI1-associated protein 3 n=1 Tax=Fasciola gigantica TaxID=46835 RepID=A0A504YFW9_FASGI|nr:hypothetical protein FGIG_00677 [Fasciola gigantica]
MHARLPKQTFCMPYDQVQLPVSARGSVYLVGQHKRILRPYNIYEQSNCERTFRCEQFRTRKIYQIIGQPLHRHQNRVVKYRTVFPASKPERLMDLKSTVDLLTSITFFRLKVQELSSPPRTGQILRECIAACIHATYQCLCENVHELYGKSVQGAAACPSGGGGSSTGVGVTNKLSSVDDQSDMLAQRQSIASGGQEHSDDMRSLTYWHRLITLIVSVLEDDRKHYAPVLNQFPHEISLGDMSAEMMWNYLSEDLSADLEHHALLARKLMDSGELLEPTQTSTRSKFRVVGRSQHNGPVGTNGPSPRIKSSDYMNLCFRVKWFYNSYIASLPQCRNKIPDYPKWFESLVMLWLTENDDVSANYLRNAYERDKQDGFQCSSEHVLYSNSVVDVFTQLNQCFDVIRKLECPDREVEGHFLHRFSLTVEKVLLAYTDRVLADFPSYQNDGRVACILVNNTQQLRVQLEKVYETMARDSLEERTNDRLTALQGRLNEAVDKLVTQLTAQFEDGVRTHVRECGRLLQKCKPAYGNHSANQRANKEDEANDCLQPLMDHFESILSVLANTCDKTVLKRVLKDVTKEPDRGLTPYQCELLDLCLDTIRTYFHAGGRGLKRSFLDRSPELHSLRQVLALYSQATDELLRDFVAIQTAQASDLNWTMTTGVFRPFVEVFIFGPLLADRKRKAATKSKSVTTMPAFNETFAFFLSNQGDPEWYELHLAVKDYCFGRNDRLVGVTVLSLSRALNLGATPLRLPLGRRLHFTETGWTVLRVLSQRVHTDEVAREFVRAKSECRPSCDPESSSTNAHGSHE